MLELVDKKSELSKQNFERHDLRFVKNEGTKQLKAMRTMTFIMEHLCFTPLEMEYSFL